MPGGAENRFDPETGALRSRLFAILRDVVVDLGSARTARSPLAEGGTEATVERLEQSLLAWQVEEAMRRIGEQHRRILRDLDRPLKCFLIRVPFIFDR